MVQAIIEIELVINQTFLFSIQDKQEKRCQYDSKPGFLFCEQYLQFIFNLELINTSFSEKEGTLCAIFFQSLTKFNWWYSPPPHNFFLVINNQNSSIMSNSDTRAVRKFSRPSLLLLSDKNKL